jgi:hypothetical protein
MAAIRHGRLCLPLKHRLLRWLGRQTWIYRGHDQLLRLLYNPDANKHFKFEVEFFGQRYCGDLGHFIDWNVFCYGSYAYNELLLLSDIARELKTLRPAPISFFDVVPTLAIIRCSWHRTWTNSSHLSPSFWFMLSLKIALNGLTNVIIFPFALGETDGDVPYFPAPDGNSRSLRGIFWPLTALLIFILLSVRSGSHSRCPRSPSPRPEHRTRGVLYPII